MQRSAPNLVLLAVIWVVLLCSSCVKHRQLINFRANEEEMVEGYTTTFELPTLKVQPDDILYIMVNSLSDETSAPYNMAAGGNRGGGGGGGNGNNQLLLQGYAVDSMGYIDFPSIGRIRVGGMALEGVRRTIAEALEPYLKNAAINVKFLNFRYTIIGDVAAPGTYTTINERVSLLEALGTAGDLTPYAERNRILLIREKDDERRVARINLQDPSFFDSPYYYLQQNDVIYIEPTEAKVATVADPTSRFISFGSAFLSLVTFTLALISSTRN